MTAQPEVKIGDILKCTNEGARIFRGQWDLVDYVIAPGGSDFLPFEATKLFFGDPRSTDRVRTLRDNRGIVSYLADRSAEVRRLRLMYDHGFGDYTGKEGVGIVWEVDKIPHIKVETLKGERVFTVLDDPAGTSVMPATPTLAEEADLRETVIRQGRLLQSLMSRFGVDSLDELDAKKNVYDPDLDEIVPERTEMVTEPEMYDELPEDR